MSLTTTFWNNHRLHFVSFTHRYCMKAGQVQPCRNFLVDINQKLCATSCNCLPVAPNRVRYKTDHFCPLSTKLNFVWPGILVCMWMEGSLHSHDVVEGASLRTNTFTLTPFFLKSSISLSIPPVQWVSTYFHVLPKFTFLTPTNHPVLPRLWNGCTGLGRPNPLPG